ncbi:AI-2E family transporter [Agromyces protaetiae]|uniref:AI-2E family transporter n=1 Tax=Agromyces protaetiae TaxID=2509455 RepID=UPI0024422B2A|nr:AI-2E family transporter [Agromyces protaetiae]
MWWRRRTDRNGGADVSDGRGSEASGVFVGTGAGADGAAAFAAEDPSPHRTAFILIGLGGAALASFGIAAIGSVLAPVLLALVLTISVHPLRVGLERRGVPRGIATGSVIVAVVLLLGGFIAALVISFAQFATLLPTYVPELQAWAEGIAGWLAGFGVGPEQIELIFSGFDPGRIVEFVGGVLGNALGLTSAFVVLLTMLILMAMDAVYAPVLNREIGARRPILVEAVHEFTTGVRKYMVVTTVLGAAQGLVNWLALLVMGVPGAPLWGILSFLCSFIPNIGYFIAIVPPLVFGGSREDGRR